MKMICQGAEAKIYHDGLKVVKERISKGYRIKQIDEQIRTRRTKSEAKILYKASMAGINVPKLVNVDKNFIPKNKFSIEMEYIDGDKLSEKLNDYSSEKQMSVMKKIGFEVYKLHKAGIIHGDLTTSNIILKGNDVYIIDFGLGYFSSKIEDKAVDLHLIKQALEAKHYMNYETLFNYFVEGYNGEMSKVLEQLKKVESRGRYKERY